VKGVLSAILAQLRDLTRTLAPADPTAKKAKVAAHLVNSLLHQ
jgi:hypothetical protein